MHIPLGGSEAQMTVYQNLKTFSMKVIVPLVSSIFCKEWLLIAAIIQTGNTSQLLKQK